MHRLLSWPASSAARRDSQGRAQHDDDHPADRDRQERPGEAGAEKPAPQPGKDDEFAGHDRGRDADRGAVARDEERQGVEDAPGEGPAAGDRAASHGAAAPGQVSGVRHPRAQGGRDAREERRQRPVGGQGHGEDGRQGRQRPVHQPAERGLDAREQERLGADRTAWAADHCDGLGGAHCTYLSLRYMQCCRLSGPLSSCRRSVFWLVSRDAAAYAGTPPGVAGNGSRGRTQPEKPYAYPRRMPNDRRRRALYAAGAAGWVISAGVMLVTIRIWQLHVREVEQRADEAERTKDEAAQRRAMEERLRIARELHDSLTHSISVISVQAGVAVHLARKRGEEAPPALLAIQEAGSDAAR